MKKHFIYLGICLLTVATLQAAEAKKETKKPAMERESAMEKPAKPSERQNSEKPQRESAMEKPSKPYEREANKDPKK